MDVIIHKEWQAVVPRSASDEAISSACQPLGRSYPPSGLVRLLEPIVFWDHIACEPFLHHPPEFPYPPCLSLLRRQVSPLVRIVDQMVEFVRTVGMAVHVLPLLRPDHPNGAVLIVSDYDLIPAL